LERIMDWQLQDAKNQFSKLVQSARTQGPQIVTVRGERAAVVLSANDYDALRANRPTLVDHLLSGPTWDQELVDAVSQREKTPGRDIAF
jgi:prevent-host-death family protein